MFYEFFQWQVGQTLGNLLKLLKQKRMYWVTGMSLEFISSKKKFKKKVKTNNLLMIYVHKPRLRQFI